MNFINKDITTIDFGFICHQVNCQGKMGAGVALAIRKKWETVFHTYFQAYKNGELKLGNVIFASVTPHICIANLCGQEFYGRKGIYTDYNALNRAIHRVSGTRNKAIQTSGTPIPVYFPNNMGCGLAGGNWNIVIKIIEKYIPDATIVNYKGES